MAHEPSTDPSNTPEAVAVRGGETGHHVRYVLAISLIASILIFGAILTWLSLQ